MSPKTLLAIYLNDHLGAAKRGKRCARANVDADCDEIPLRTDPRLRSGLENACASADVRPRVALEASDPQILAGAAARGLGVAILPKSITHARPDRLHALAITRPIMRGRIELAWRAKGPRARRDRPTRTRPQHPSRPFRQPSTAVPRRITGRSGHVGASDPSGSIRRKSREGSVCDRGREPQLIVRGHGGLAVEKLLDGLNDCGAGGCSG
jgi:LysR substrate binding domain